MEPSVTVTVHLRPEGADLGSLERAVQQALNSLGAELWQHLVDLLEAALPRPTE